MNNIKIKFDPFQKKCMFEMNNMPLPKYSSLNAYVNKSILEMASSLIQTISDELNDEFSLAVIGPKFEQYFIRDLQNSYDDCIAYSVENYEVSVELRERFESTKSIANRHEKTEFEEYKEKIYSEISINIDTTLAKQVEGADESTIIIARNEESAKTIVKSFVGQLVLCVSEKNKVISVGQNKYIWCVKEEQINECLESAVERFAIPKYIELVASTVKETDDIQAQKVVETQTKIEAAMSVKIQEEVIEGDFINLDIYSEGKKIDDSNIRIESSDVRIIGFEQNRIFAFKAGQAEISFYKGNEIEAFDKVLVTVKADNLVKEIVLTAPEKIKVGNIYKINAVYVPADAANISRAKWSVGNEAIGQISSDGMLTALSAGKTIITVETERKTESIEIEIIENIKEIQILSNELDLHIGQKKVVDLDIVGNKSLFAEITAKSSNPKVAEVSKNENGDWVVTGKGVLTAGKGECKIIFSTEDGNCKCECKVVVSSTIRAQEEKSKYIRSAAIFTLLAIIPIFFANPLGHYCSMVAGIIAIVLGVIGIIKTKQNVFWHILLMFVAGFITLDMILTIFT